jgi:hypothetical protein
MDELVGQKGCFGWVGPALITIIPIGDPNESTVFKSEIPNKSIR